MGDLNIIETPEKLSKAIKYLRKEFEMKDLEKIKIFLGLQIEHLVDEIFVHQSTYTRFFFKRLYMDKTHSLNISMQVHSLDVKKYIFCLQDDKEKLFGPEVSCHNANGALNADELGRKQT